MPRKKPRKSAENGNHNRNNQPVSYQLAPLFVFTSPLCLLPFECIVHWTAHYTYADAIGMIHCMMRCVRRRRKQQCGFDECTSIVFPSFQFHRCVFRSWTLYLKQTWVTRTIVPWTVWMKWLPFEPNRQKKFNDPYFFLNHDGHEKRIAKGNDKSWERKKCF